MTTYLTRRYTKGAEGNVTVTLDCPLMPSSVSTGSLTSTQRMRQHDAHHWTRAASYTGHLQGGKQECYSLLVAQMLIYGYTGKIKHTYIWDIPRLSLLPLKKDKTTESNTYSNENF